MNQHKEMFEPPEQGSVPVHEEARGDEAPEATLAVGHNPIGGYLSFSLDPDRNQPGTPAAPEMCRALRFADRRLGTGFGPLTPARNVRP